MSSLTEQMLWLSVSVSCIRYSKKHKFRPKMHQNAFVGQAPPRPAGGRGELERSPRPSSCNWGVLLLAGSDPDVVWDVRLGWARNEAGIVGVGDR